MAPMFEKFLKLDPTFKGPITTQTSVEMMMQVIERATVEKDAGVFVSHHGDKNWL
jgi:hypothetical protein